MATLTVWKFDSASGAGDALSQLGDMQKQRLIEILDAAIVEWPEGKGKPRTRQAINLVGVGAMGGAFWGMLFGLLFFMPLLGAAVGAAAGALGGLFQDYGIDDSFIKQVRDEVTEGTSALFLLTGQVTVDKVEEEFKGKMGTLIRSNLSDEQEARLRGAFGHEE